MIDYNEGYPGYSMSSSQEIYEDLRDTNKRYRTASLFEEMIQPETRKHGYDPLYSLREYEHNDKPSAYQIYMHCVDEAEAALKLVGSYAHWRKLCALKWFIAGSIERGFEGLAQWRKDMAERDKTTAKRSLLLQVAEGNVTAARSLHKMAVDDAAAADRILPKRTRKEQASKQDTSIVEFLSKHKDN